MDRDDVRALLEEVKRGALSPEEAAERLASLPFVKTAQSHLDTHRALRQGIPEVIFGAPKSVDQIAELVNAQLGAGQPALITRIAPEVASAVAESVPGGRYDAAARLLWYGDDAAEPGVGCVCIVSAGTSDAPVAAEAVGVARRLGNRVEEVRDVGVAGLQRLLAYTETLRRARVLIVIAGMEGALPSVVGGLVAAPVIAVPTSVGYGLSLGGVTALLGMLSSCAANVTAVNIDNGFGAAYVATLINRG
jgi:NCAIR mutase (PurE)-related protein